MCRRAGSALRLRADRTGRDVAQGKRLEECFQALKNSLQVVAIDLDKGDDAQVIFETLNARGEPLLPADLLRNYIFLHAIEQGLPIPIGTQDAGVLNTSINDEDVDAPGLAAGTLDDEMDNGNAGKTVDVGSLSTEAEFKRRAAEAYSEYASQYKSRFKWLRPNLFNKNLARDLKADVQALFKILQVSSKWDAGKDAKLRSLIELLNIEHPDEKVLVFTQYADTVRYLETQLKAQNAFAKFARTFSASSFSPIRTSA